MIKKVLAATQDTSDEFLHPGGLAFLLLSAHAGGTWKLQCLSPDAEWVDCDGTAGVEFSSSGMIVWYGQGLLNYRLEGTVAGAKAWILSNNPVPGVKPFGADA